MKRIALILAVLGILSVAVGQAQAHDHHGYNRSYHGAYAKPYHGGYCGPRVVYPPVFYGPPRIVPAQIYPPPVYYYPRYYAPVPRSGIYYQNRGLSIGIGF